MHHTCMRGEEQRTEIADLASLNWTRPDLERNFQQMTERRYNEAEVAAIFERATEAPVSGSHMMTTSGDGMTLLQLQEIGAEVGISADAIELAARTVHEGPPRARRTFLGIPIGASKTIPLERALTEGEWERLVVELRDTFGARGTMSSQGSLRQWTNGNLQVLHEPTANGHRIQLKTQKSDAPALLIAGIAMSSGSAALLTTAVMAGALADKGMLVAVGVLGVAGAVLFGLTAMRLPGWARTRQQQFDAIAVRVAHMTKSLPPGSEK